MQEKIGKLKRQMQQLRETDRQPRQQPHCCLSQICVANAHNEEEIGRYETGGIAFACRRDLSFEGSRGRPGSAVEGAYIDARRTGHTLTPQSSGAVLRQAHTCSA
ncbi:hypothetical protein [Paraburkholderia sp. BL10I2N1]|uniref:hypothetical protein n=1 Tax=Paraburkholderia sp. BL10I2N1 TaxID=1938796 RepID=UPI001061E2D6|nr:hypothetical protein [Paraburkholderia sp. BL10I2N1]